MDEDPFLVSRDGEVWACWLSGKPAVNLGSEQNFWVIAEKLFNELHPLDERTPPATAKSTKRPDKPSADPPPVRADLIDRNEPRYDITLIGRIYGVGGSREVTIFDLSTRGCRVRDYASPREGANVSVKIGTIGPVAGIVRWRRDDFIGIKFNNPLYPAVLDAIRSEQSLR